jgi:hypothetical protein
MYGPYYDSLAAVPNRELSTYLPGRDAAKDAEPIKTQTAKHEGFLWDKKDFSFEDVLDLINPLQHIPLISSMYRESTGDTIGAVPRVLGDALFGGGLVGAAIGAASALVNVAVEAVTGKDVGGTMMALLSGDHSDGTAVAERESGTSSAVGSDALAATTANATGAGAGAAKTDGTKAADTETPPTPAEELSTFPGVNMAPAKDAARDKPADRKAAISKTGAHDGVGGQPVGPNYGAALGGTPAVTPRRSGDGANAWVNQSIMSGLEKYRTMARDQDKKPAGVDALY